MIEKEKTQNTEFQNELLAQIKRLEESIKSEKTAKDLAEEKC